MYYLTPLVLLLLAPWSTATMPATRSKMTSFASIDEFCTKVFGIDPTPHSDFMNHCMIEDVGDIVAVGDCQLTNLWFLSAGRNFPSGAD
jgi:hypothetical protein